MQIFCQQSCLLRVKFKKKANLFLIADVDKKERVNILKKNMPQALKEKSRRPFKDGTFFTSYG